MSYTISRGFHDASRWRTPALALLELLEGKSRQPYHQGAITAFEQFFEWGLAGCLSLSGGKSRYKRVPLMAGACAFSIASQALRKDNIRGVKRWCKKHLKTVRRMKVDGRAFSTKPRYQKLRRFLTSLCAL